MDFTAFLKRGQSGPENRQKMGLDDVIGPIFWVCPLFITYYLLAKFQVICTSISLFFGNVPLTPPQPWEILKSPNPGRVNILMVNSVPFLTAF